MLLYENYCQRRNAVIITPVWAVALDFSMIATERFIASPFLLLRLSRDHNIFVFYMVHTRMLLHNYDVAERL